jgi:hypothetical protein
MTPIINPWVFYFMDVANALKVIAVIMSVLAASTSIFFFIYAMTDFDICGEDDDDSQYNKKMAKKFAWLTTPLLVAAILLPGKDTIVKMFIAQNVTDDRMSAAVDVVSEVYNDIIGILEPESGEEVSK